MRFFMLVCGVMLASACYPTTRVSLPSGATGYEVWCVDSLIGCYNAAGEKCGRYSIIASQTSSDTDRTRMLVVCQ